jgi:glucose/mannose-6-phosphate isomerase
MNEPSDVNLDDADILSELDPAGMAGHMTSLPDQILEAVRLADRTDVGGGGQEIENVVFAGMGGSAIGGDMAGSIASSHLRVPFEVTRFYSLPAYVGPGSLVFASSYSGNTEETISAYEEASASGARVIVTTTGGRLGELASERGHPTAFLPQGYPPRAAIGFGLVLPTVFMSRLGLIPDMEEDFSLAAGELRANIEKLVPFSSTQDNPAKETARSILGRLPVVYGSEGTTSPLAIRWKGQISENGKQLAYSHVIPEMNHNEIVGWEAEEEYVGSTACIFLRDEDDHDRVKRRIDITSELLASRGASVHHCSGNGSTILSRLFSLISLGDFVSLYLAFLRRVDPTPVRIIEELKKRLREDSK